MHPSLPRTLGRYRLLEPLARGGTSCVWTAELTGLVGFRRQVALKVADPTPTARELLFRESRVACHLTHPNLVGAWEVGRRGPWAWMAMPLVDGSTVAQLLDVWGPLPGRAVLQLGRELCHGLNHLHGLCLDGGRGLVHRDVKPGNVLVGLDGRVRLIDLGLVAETSPHAAPARAGTPGFMAPEQLAGRQVDARTDLFSLGALLATACLGSHATRWLRTVPVDHLSRRVRRLAASVDQCSAGLGRIVAACLQPDPDDRPRSAAHVRRDLHALERTTDGVGLAEMPVARLPALPTLPTLPTAHALTEAA